MRNKVPVRIVVTALVIFNLIDILYAKKRPHLFINLINIIPILPKVFLSCFFLLFYVEIIKENTSWCMLQNTKDLELSYEI